MNQEQEIPAKGLVKARFKNLEDLTVQEFSYRSEHKIEDAHKVFGVELPTTKNVIRFKYEGKIKVAYDFEKPKVDDAKMTIAFKLEKPRITDNYLVKKTVYDEETTLTNKIESDQINRDDEMLKKEGLGIAIDNGLYEKADKQARKLIKKNYKGLGYKVLFEEVEGGKKNEK